MVREDADSSQGGKPAQLEPGNDLTAEEEALLSSGTRAHAATRTRFVNEGERWAPLLGPCKASVVRRQAPPVQRAQRATAKTLSLVNAIR